MPTSLSRHILTASSPRARAPWLPLSGLMLALVGGGWGCVGPKEAPSVEMPVVVDRSAIVPKENDLGYQIQLTQARVVVRNIVFTVGGQAHGSGESKGSKGNQDKSSWQSMVESWLIPRAYAHPGHFEGGEVTGELKGRFVLNYFDKGEGPQEIGTALLLHGEYTSANFVLGLGGKKDGLEESDPLFGHTAVLSGVATKDDTETKFEAIIDAPDGREVLGIPFELQVDAASSERLLGFRLRTVDIVDDESMFDGIDFAQIKRDEKGVAKIFAGVEDKVAQKAYTRIRRTFQTQAQFDIQAAQMADEDAS